MKKWKIITLISWIFLITFPLILGHLNSDGDNLFGGLFFNPIDGYSYFAKMQQGYAGEFAFQLPYASQTNNDIYIFTFYILLGHFARIVGLSIPFTFHFFRIGIAILFFFSLEPILNKFFSKDDIFYKFSHISLLFGGGLGWIFFLFGDLPIDFWVSEAFIFLSAFSNPHFILTYLIISLLWNLLLSSKITTRSLIVFFILGMTLVSISPFAAILFGLVICLKIIIFKDNFCTSIFELLSFGIPVALIGAYQYFSIKSDPILDIWNSQNVTLTPEFLNLLFGFSPLLIGIIFLLILVVRKNINISKSAILLLAWIASSIVLAYVSFNLQRRFLVGIYFPLSIVFWYLFSLFYYQQKKQGKKFLPLTILVLSLFSNLIIFAGSLNALSAQDQIFFIKSDVVKTVNWLDTNSKQKSVILTTEKTGLEIPALGYYRVVYGHPFESLHAEDTLQMVIKFWKNQLSDQDAIAFLIANNVNYIFCEFENSIQDCPKITNNYEIVFNRKNVVLFQVQN